MTRLLLEPNPRSALKRNQPEFRKKKKIPRACSAVLVPEGASRGEQRARIFAHVLPRKYQLPHGARIQNLLCEFEKTLDPTGLASLSVNGMLGFCLIMESYAYVSKHVLLGQRHHCQQTRIQILT